MRTGINHDVLGLLEQIRAVQAARGGCPFEEALETAWHDLGRPARPDGMRAALVAGAAWALYALELHDAEADASHRRDARECAQETNQ